MNRLYSNSTRLLAGAFALLLGSTAVFADIKDYEQLRDSVQSQLTALQVPTDGLGTLSTNQLAELTALMSGTDTDADKAMSAEFLLQSFLHPSVVALDSAEGKQLVADLTTQLDAIGVAYPTQPLTATQIQALLNAINGHKNVSTQKQTIEAVLARINRPASVTATNEGVVQMEAGIAAKLTGLGITPPAAGTMTFEQLGKLEGIFSTTETSDADKKSSAILVLGLN